MLLPSFFLCFLPQAGVTVTLPVEARVKGTEIELGELCLVTGLDAELVARVRALELGYAPAPGFSRLFAAERLQAELERAVPGLRVTLAGERACRVWPEIEELAPATLEEAARTELARAFAGREAVFVLAEPIPAVTVPLGERGGRLVARPHQGALVSGVIGVPIEVLVDDLRYRTVWTSWRVDVWETRPVLARAVRAGEELRPDLFASARVQVASASTLEALDPRQVVGSVAKRDLAPGERVTAHDVHRPAAITLGATLFLRVKKGSIEARVSAVALETGSVGDRIRVKTADGRQELVATVVGRDLCEITL
ncbi:MAG TPA: flagellar basal body P-ring formation chaperone FlgA [Planctomycetota bacterium]